MPYKVENESTARALSQHWHTLGVLTEMANRGPYWEVILKDPKEHPMWREVNDAFMSGRLSALR